MPTPPRPMARPGASSLGQHQRGAGLREARRQPACSHPVEHGERRHVERLLQRLADRDRALEGEIEIPRRIGAVAHRPILDQRFRMDEAVLEAEAVDERLERRAGRAQRLRHVHLAGAALVEIIGRADMRPKPRPLRCRRRAWRARHRARASAPACATRSRASSSQILLQVGVDGEPDLASPPAPRRSPDRRRAAPAWAWDAGRWAPVRPWRARSRRPARGRSRRSGRARGSCAVRAAAAERSGRRSSGDCGSATSSAASPSESRRGSLPK